MGWFRRREDVSELRRDLAGIGLALSELARAQKVAAEPTSTAPEKPMSAEVLVRLAHIEATMSALVGRVAAIEGRAPVAPPDVLERLASAERVADSAQRGVNALRSQINYRRRKGDDMADPDEDEDDDVQAQLPGVLGAPNWRS